MKETKGPEPFSPDVLAIYQRIRRTVCPEERGTLLLQLANHYAERYDASDEGLPEDLHEVVDTYHQKYLGYNQAGLKLGRALLVILQEQAPEEDVDVSHTSTSVAN